MHLADLVAVEHVADLLQADLIVGGRAHQDAQHARERVQAAVAPALGRDEDLAQGIVGDLGLGTSLDGRQARRQFPQQVHDVVLIGAHLRDLDLGVLEDLQQRLAVGTGLLELRQRPVDLDEDIGAVALGVADQLQQSLLLLGTQLRQMLDEDAAVAGLVQASGGIVAELAALGVDPRLARRVQQQAEVFAARPRAADEGDGPADLDRLEHLAGQRQHGLRLAHLELLDHRREQRPGADGDVLAHEVLQRLGRDRLGEHVLGAGLHGLDRPFDVGVAGHHRDREQQQAFPLPLLDQFDAVDARWHPNVDKSQINLLAPHHLVRLVAVGGGEDLVAHVIEQLDIHLADAALVIGDQDSLAAAFAAGRQGGQAVAVALARRPLGRHQAAIRKRTVKRAPGPRALWMLSTSIDPPAAWISLWTRARPKPCPLILRDMCGLKISDW